MRWRSSRTVALLLGSWRRQRESQSANGAVSFSRASAATGAAGDPVPFYARKWAEVLAGDTASVASFLVERSDLAAELRQSSPFAGALSPQERWAILRETQERFSRAQ